MGSLVSVNMFAVMQAETELIPGMESQIVAMDVVAMGVVAMDVVAMDVVAMMVPYRAAGIQRRARADASDIAFTGTNRHAPLLLEASILLGLAGEMRSHKRAGSMLVLL